MRAQRRVQGKIFEDTRVWAIMEPPVPSIGPNESIEKCMTLMTERRVRYLPVLKEGRSTKNGSLR